MTNIIIDIFLCIKIYIFINNNILIIIIFYKYVLKYFKCYLAEK